MWCDHFPHFLAKSWPEKITSRGGCFGTLPFFARQKKRIFLFFLWGPKTQPLEVAFSLRERVGLRSQKGRILGKKIAWGREGRTGQKKEKRMHKKRWVPAETSHFMGSCRGGLPAVVSSPLATPDSWPSSNSHESPLTRVPTIYRERKPCKP